MTIRRTDHDLLQRTDEMPERRESPFSKTVENPNKNGTSPPCGYPREAQHISVRDGDKIYLNRARFRLERDSDSDETLEIINVLPSPAPLKPPDWRDIPQDEVLEEVLQERHKSLEDPP